MDVWI